MNEESEKLRLQIRAKRQRLYRIKKQLENPKWQEEQNAKSREYYKKTAKKQIANSRKWQKNNPERARKIKRDSYQKNKVEINKRRREARSKRNDTC